MDEESYFDGPQWEVVEPPWEVVEPPWDGYGTPLLQEPTEVCDCERLLGILEPGDEVPCCADGVCERIRRLACWEWARLSVPCLDSRVSTVQLASNPFKVRWQAYLPDGRCLLGDHFPAWPMCSPSEFELVMVLRQYCEDPVANLAAYWRKQKRWDECVRKYLDACHSYHRWSPAGFGLQFALDEATELLFIHGFPEEATSCLLTDARQLEAQRLSSKGMPNLVLGNLDPLPEEAARRACVQSFVTQPTYYGKTFGFSRFRVLSEVVLPDARYTSADLWAAAGRTVASHAAWAAQAFGNPDAEIVDTRQANWWRRERPLRCPDANIAAYLEGDLGPDPGGRQQLYAQKIEQARESLGRPTTVAEERRIKAQTRATVNRWKKKPDNPTNA